MMLVNMLLSIPVKCRVPKSTLKVIAYQKTASFKGYEWNVNGIKTCEFILHGLIWTEHGQHQTGSNILLYGIKRWINYNEETIVMYPGIIMTNSHAFANVFT